MEECKTTRAISSSLGRRRKAACARWALFAVFFLTFSSVWLVAQNPGPQTPFQGRALLVLSDTDMKASAYIDGMLGEQAGVDTLSVVSLGVAPKDLHFKSVPVSNSVAGPPQCIAVSPDGKTAVAIETYGPRPAGKPNATMKELAPGGEVTIIDLSNLNDPRITQKIKGFERPLSVSIDRTGSLVAIVYGLPSGPNHPALAVYWLKDGRLSGPITPRIPGFQPQDVLISAEFDPQQDVLALAYTTHPRLSLLQYKITAEDLQLSNWGNDVGLDHQPFLIRFSPDGRFAVINDMYYGSDVAEAPGTLLSVAIGATNGSNGSPIHQIVSHESAEHSPEGLAMSPNGKWVVTTNLEHSPEPIGSPRQGFFSSVSLFSFNSQSGRLSKVGTFPFDGVLPEAAEFDNSSRLLAVANYDSFDAKSQNGSIDFWRLVEDASNPGRTLLIRTNDSLPVARGPQSMAIVR